MHIDDTKLPKRISTILIKNGITSTELLSYYCNPQYLLTLQGLGAASIREITKYCIENNITIPAREHPHINLGKIHHVTGVRKTINGNIAILTAMGKFIIHTPGTYHLGLSIYRSERIDDSGMQWFPTIRNVLHVGVVPDDSNIFSSEDLGAAQDLSSNRAIDKLLLIRAHSANYFLELASGAP